MATKGKRKDESWEKIGQSIGRKIEKESKDQDISGYDRMRCQMKSHGSGSAFYGLGFLGALVYYITTAPTIWLAIFGFFKALVWPAFLVYGAMKYLGL